MCYLYTLDDPLYAELNKGSREGDQSKIDTLGPFAAAFGRIIGGAAHNRKDIDELKHKIEEKGIVVYRGAGIKPT